MDMWKPGDGFLRLPPPAAEGFSRANRTEKVDVVIVGAGPGGSSAARVLANAGAKVLVLEEGPAKSRFAPNQGHTMRYHMQEGGTMVAMGERAFMPIAAGRGLGGGTLINSAIAWRAPDAILNGWAELLKDDSLSAAALKPYYDEIWELLGVSKPNDFVAGANNRLIVRGVKKLGYEGGYLDRYTPTCLGCGICYFGCPSGGKSSTNLNLLPEAVNSGCRILADTKITGILVENGVAVGVQGRMFDPDTRESGGSVTIHADRVILACGGIGTPRLLHHAKVALGPAVGKGLHVHPGNMVMGVCEEPIELWKGATQGAWFHVPELPGVLPHTFSGPPEVCLMVQRKVGAEVKKGIAELPYLCGLVVMVSDKGEGTVGAYADGRAKISYDFNLHDLERTKAGMVEAAKVLFAGGVREVMAPVYGTGRYSSPEAFKEALYARSLSDFSLYAAHPMSTCRMGLDPQTSVVNPSGETHALKNLYLLDGSIFPTSLGVNPSITIFALATRMARALL
jgi:choline dehydrogenase-like flavoprotein